MSGCLRETDGSCSLRPAMAERVLRFETAHRFGRQHPECVASGRVVLVEANATGAKGWMQKEIDANDTFRSRWGLVYVDCLEWAIISLKRLVSFPVIGVITDGRAIIVKVCSID